MKKILEFLRALLYVFIPHIVVVGWTYFDRRFEEIETYVGVIVLFVLMSVLYFPLKPKHLNPWIHWGTVLVSRFLLVFLLDRTVIRSLVPNNLDGLPASFAQLSLVLVGVVLAVCDAFYMIYTWLKNRIKKKTPNIRAGYSSNFYPPNCL